MTINKNKWIYCIICRFTLSRWLEAQHAAPLQLRSLFHCQLEDGKIFQFSVVNCPLLWPNGGGVKRSTERSVKKSRLSERSEFSEILAQRPRP